MSRRYRSQNSRRDAVMNHLIQPRALFGRGERRTPHGTGRQGRYRPCGAAAKAGELALAEREVLSQAHAHELGCEMQHQRGIELAAVRVAAGFVEIAGEVERKDVDREDASLPGTQRGEGFLVRIVAVGRENNESIHAALLPGAEQIVHPAMQGLAADGRIAGIGTFGCRIHAKGDSRGTQNPEFGGEVVGQPLDDDRIASERQMRSMLFTRADRHEQT